MLFKNIIGHAELKQNLIRQIQQDRMAHARLFSGSEGDAKLALALAFITYLMCTNRGEDDACGECAACTKNAKLIHPDVHLSFPVIPKKSGDKPVSDDYVQEFRNAVLSNVHMNVNDWLNFISAENKQGNITAEECRSIIHKLSMKPFESDKRVLLMWLPEYLGGVGNSLLKIIEEPADKTYFILITEQPEHILPTILSRVQQLRIQPYSEGELTQWLMENEGLDESAARSVSFMADGDVAQAKRLILQSAEDFNPTVHFQIWMRHCFNYKLAEITDWSDKTATMGRENIKAFLTYSLRLIRECLAYITIPDYVIRQPDAESEFVRNFSRVLQITNIETLYAKINKAISEIERNANARITLYNLSLQIGIMASSARAEKKN
ncbi:MAG: DNA polymerase III subunit delta [Bacteroidetes bacterium]|nr:DNA polymerase III subunit delta [Bacteroidota bacterium]